MGARVAQAEGRAERVAEDEPALVAERRAHLVEVGDPAGHRVVGARAGPAAAALVVAVGAEGAGGQVGDRVEVVPQTGAAVQEHEGRGGGGARGGGAEAGGGGAGGFPRVALGGPGGGPRAGGPPDPRPP